MQPGHIGETARGVTYSLAALTLLVAGQATAQDANVLLPVDEIEQRLGSGEFQIIDARPSRGIENERTLRAALSFDDGAMLVVKWAPAPSGGGEFNNNPRYELGAYEFQKLFLDPNDYVVPPTIAAAFDTDWHEANVRDEPPTFWKTGSVVVVLQYWLFNVTDENFWDERRFARDTAYARHFGDFNLLTHLIRHNDQNAGNFLISAAPENPRVFSVDNGLAFNTEESDQGARWRRLVVDRLPAHTIERLREITEEDLIRQLETLAQFRVEAGGVLVREPPGPASKPNDGIRRDEDVIQFGLTRREIRGVWRRITRLLNDVDDGDIEVF
jgi:hypothetical protein